MYQKSKSSFEVRVSFDRVRETFVVILQESIPMETTAIQKSSDERSQTEREDSRESSTDRTSSTTGKPHRLASIARLPHLRSLSDIASESSRINSKLFPGRSVSTSGDELPSTGEKLSLSLTEHLGENVRREGLLTLIDSFRSMIFRSNNIWTSIWSNNWIIEHWSEHRWTYLTEMSSSCCLD